MRHEHTDFTLFQLQEEDAPELAALEAACFALPWSEEQYKKILRQQSLPSPPAETASALPRESSVRLPATPVFGMRAANGELAAYICLGVYQATREAEIYNIAVRVSFRRHGLGKRLLAHALKAACRHGIERALLEVRPSNVAALALYASSGFAVCGSRKNYYKDSGEDALILACELAPVFGENSFHK